MFKHFTNEELDELLRIPNPNCSTGDDYGYRSVRNDWSDDWEDIEIYKPKRKHEFTPVLLIFSTAYHCKHCGAKKEENKGDYCEA